MKYIENKLKNDALAFKQSCDEVLHNKIIASLPQARGEQKKLVNGFSFKLFVPTFLAITALFYIGFGFNKHEQSSLPIEPIESEFVEQDFLSLDLFTFEEKAVNTIIVERQAILDDFAYIQSLIVL